MNRVMCFVVVGALALVGVQDTLHYIAPAPETTWTTYSIVLAPSGWKLNDYRNGPEPTLAEMESVLANLQALYISGDWIDGTETSGLDNVSLVPVPGTLVLLGSGAFFVVACRRARRRNRR